MEKRSHASCVIHLVLYRRSGTSRLWAICHEHKHEGHALGQAIECPSPQCSMFLSVLADQHIGYQRLTCLTARFHGVARFVQIDPLASDIIRQNQTVMTEWDCRVRKATVGFKESILDYKIPPSRIFSIPTYSNWSTKEQLTFLPRITLHRDPSS